MKLRWTFGHLPSMETGLFLPIKGKKRTIACRKRFDKDTRKYRYTAKRAPDFENHRVHDGIGRYDSLTGIKGRS